MTISHSRKLLGLYNYGNHLTTPGLAEVEPAGAAEGGRLV